MAVAGKVCIVTGGSRGCGRGIALALAKEGAIVYITGRGAKSKMSASTLGKVGANALEQSAAEATEAGRAAGGRCVPYVCDHSNDDAVEQLVSDVFDREGRVDLLVNNAYAGTDPENEANWLRPFYERPLEAWDATNVVGLRSNYVAMLAVSKRWVAAKQRGGLIVQITSATTVAYQFDVIYGVSKAAIDRLTADAARELQPHGCSVVSLFPGAAATETLLAKLEPGGPFHGNKTFKELESTEFMGRGIVAMLADKGVLKRLSGRVVMSPELAELYGFTDVNGKVPWGFLRPMRKAMGFPPAQYALKKSDLRPLKAPAKL